jgi:hypothetical protein
MESGFQILPEVCNVVVNFFNFCPNYAVMVLTSTSKSDIIDIDKEELSKVC